MPNTSPKPRSWCYTPPACCPFERSGLVRSLDRRREERWIVRSPWTVMGAGAGRWMPAAIASSPSSLGESPTMRSSSTPTRLAPSASLAKEGLSPRFALRSEQRAATEHDLAVAA